jgi:ABC-type transport system involved in cytochrome bd biosynthesis fused ATPase/permease subunit
VGSKHEKATDGNDMSMINIESLIFNYPSGEFQLETPAFTVARGEKAAVIGKRKTSVRKLLHKLGVQMMGGHPFLEL